MVGFAQWHIQCHNPNLGLWNPEEHTIETYLLALKCIQSYVFCESDKNSDLNFMIKGTPLAIIQKVKAINTA